MLTKGGIELNLNESQYFFNIHDYTFFFSSRLYYEKFIDEFQNYLRTQSQKIKLKYEITIDNDLFLLISLYKKIEKRGFRIYDEKRQLEISENVTFNSIIINY